MPEQEAGDFPASVIDKGFFAAGVVAARQPGNVYRYLLAARFGDYLAGKVEWKGQIVERRLFSANRRGCAVCVAGKRLTILIDKSTRGVECQCQSKLNTLRQP